MPLYAILQANEVAERERAKRFSYESRQADLRDLGGKNGAGIRTH